MGLVFLKIARIISHMFEENAESFIYPSPSVMELMGFNCKKMFISCVNVHPNRTPTCQIQSHLIPKPEVQNFENLQKLKHIFFQHILKMLLISKFQFWNVRTFCLKLGLPSEISKFPEKVNLFQTRNGISLFFFINCVIIHFISSAKFQGSCTSGFGEGWLNIRQLNVLQCWAAHSYISQHYFTVKTHYLQNRKCRINETFSNYFGYM